MTVSNEIAEFLQDRGFGILGTDIFFQMPTSPDRAIAILETPGDAPITCKRRIGPVLERPRFQITVRDLSYADADRLSGRIYRELMGFHGIINGIGYSRILALQSPFWLRRDESRRTEFVNTYQAWKQPSLVE